MKEKNEVIQEFKELVNMTAQELKEWLKGDDSTSAGWSKDDGSGESVGHDSGRRIVEILESNPDKDPEKYTDDDISHMRKVVSYCKRHLAQEEKANNKKPIEEVKKTKSYASLKNWGHDPIKKRQANGGGSQDKADNKEKEEEEGKEEKAGEKLAGEKRKAPDDQSGKSKKRETEDGAAEVEDDEGKDGEEEDAEGEDAEGEESNEKNSNGKEKKNGQQNEKGSGKGDASKGPKKGETVSWNWGQGQPEGKVKEVNPDETTVQTKKGSKVTRKGDEQDPAVVLDTGKTEAVKLNHELNETED